MKRKKILIFILIGIVDVLLLYLLSNLFADIKLGLTDVVVVNTTLSERECIEEEHLDKIKLPKAYVNENVLQRKEDVIGKYVKRNTSIPKGSLIYEGYVDSLSEMKDRYILSLKENESSYDLFLKDIQCNPAAFDKGMCIDLYCTINRQVVLSDLLISNVRILALYDRDFKEIKNKNMDDVYIITIALNNDMIPLLNKALLLGNISVSISSNTNKDCDTFMNTNSSIYNYLK